MYNRFQLGLRYLEYYITASNSKGHGIHSPFVYKFVRRVLLDKKSYDCFPYIEKRRAELLKDETTIEVKDLGAGSSQHNTRVRKVKDIAASSLKPRKYAQLLYRIVQYFEPKRVLELGTSLGITTCYLASGHDQLKLHTLEGAPAIAAIARENFSILKRRNIQLLEGDFSETLPQLLRETGIVNLAYIDGNHRRGPTLAYFELLLKHAIESSVIILDDIHWSSEMEEAWKAVQDNPAVTLTIDLFFIGLVFLNPDVREKQHFKIRY